MSNAPENIGIGTPGEINVDWYRTPIGRDLMRTLMQRSDLQGLRQCLLQLSLTAATGTAAYYAFYHSHWAVFVLAFYVHGTLSGFMGLGGPAHELCHRTVFKTRALNEFFLAIYSFYTWTNYPHFRASHGRHHQVTVYSGHDEEVVLPMTMRLRDWLFSFTINPVGVSFFVFPAFRYSLGMFNTAWDRKRLPASHGTARRRVKAWARVLVLGHLALICAFVYFEQWALLLIVHLAPFSAGWLVNLCGFPQHAGLAPDVSDFRLSCRTFKLNWFCRFLYWNMNYHVEHHMYANVPFYNMEKLHDAIKHDLPPANPGLKHTWKEIAAIAREQKKDPSYVFVPELPE